MKYVVSLLIALLVGCTGTRQNTALTDSVRKECAPHGGVKNDDFSANFLIENKAIVYVTCKDEIYLTYYVQLPVEE